MVGVVDGAEDGSEDGAKVVGAAVGADAHREVASVTQTSARPCMFERF